MPQNRQRNRRKEVPSNRADHLIPYRFKKGEPSANPGGRPKKLSKELEKQLAARVPGDKKKRSYAQKFIDSVLHRAIKKSDVLAKEIFDRIEGKLSYSAEEQGKPGVQVIILDAPRPEGRARLVAAFQANNPKPTDKP